MSTYLVSTVLGVVTVEFTNVSRYDVENIVRDRAYSQAIALRNLNKGKAVAPTQPVSDRTLQSIYVSTSEELPT